MFSEAKFPFLLDYLIIRLLTPLFFCNILRCFRCFGNRRDALETEEDVVESSYILKRVHIMSSEAIQVPVFNLILWIFRPPLGKKISLTRSFGRKFN